MPEQLGGEAEIPTIELPSALRIRQRMGMLATSQSFREALIPSLTELEGEVMTPASLAAELESKTTAYAEAHMMGLARLVQEGVPKIIEKIIDDPSQKDAALDAWEALKAKRMAEDEVANEELSRRYRQGPSRHQRRRALRRGRY